MCASLQVEHLRLLAVQYAVIGNAPVDDG